MAKRTAAFAAAMISLWPVVAAGATNGPLWPCVVTVWVQDGARLPQVAKAALSQLDAATAASWPLVDDPDEASVSVRWADLESGVGGLATVSATDVEKVGAEVLVDPSVSDRWVMYLFLHEFGHVAGLDHNSEVSVMGGGDVPFRRFTEWDLAGLAAIGCR